MNKQSFKIEGIFLRESYLKKHPKFSERKREGTPLFDITSEHYKEANKLIVEVTLKYREQTQKHPVFTIKIVFAGIFKIPRHPVLPAEEFARINAPAIIFPFVREHFANLLMKAGITPVFIETINFVEK